MATSRNGHDLKDMYNPETNTLDIRSNGLYPSNVLSNLCSNSFRFDGMICGSMANPFALEYASLGEDGEDPAVAYATVYPAGIFLRVISAQIIILLLS